MNLNLKYVNLTHSIHSRDFLYVPSYSIFIHIPSMSDLSPKFLARCGAGAHLMAHLAASVLLKYVPRADAASHLNGGYFPWLRGWSTIVESPLSPLGPSPFSDIFGIAIISAHKSDLDRLHHPTFGGSGAPWCPLVPPGAPWCPLVPRCA